MLIYTRIAITCVLLLAGYASSATRTWNGGGANNNWSTAANWTPATAPIAGDDLVFAGTTRLGPVNDIASGTTFNSISFSTGAGNFNLTGNPLNLSGGATALTCNSTYGTMMIQLTITYTAAPTVANPGAGSSNLMIFDQVTGGYTINVAGTGNIDFAGPITGAGGISKNGTGTLKLQGGSSFTGAVNIATGLVIVTNPSGLGSTSGGTTVQAGAAIEFGNVNYSAAEPLTLNGTGISTTGAMTNNSGSGSTFGGPITLGSATSIVAGTGNLTLSNTTPITGSFALTLGGGATGTMSAGITGGSAGLTKAGAGTWYMNGSGSSSTGDVSVNDGTLEITGSGSIPLGNITVNTATFAIHDNGPGNNGVIDYNRTLTTGTANTATLYVANAGANTGNSIKFNGYNLGNAIVVATGANGYKLELGPLTLNGAGSGTATLSSGSADFIVGNVTGNAQTHTLSLVGTGGGSRINGVLSDGAAAVTVSKAGAGAWTLAGSNTYTGTTSVTAGALVVASNNALGSASAGTTVSSGAVLDLSGTNYSTPEPLTLNGTGIASGGALVNTNAAGAIFAGPITLGSASSIVGATGTIALGNTGAISGSYGLTLGGAQGGSLACTLPSGNLTKNGTGTWTLNGSTALSLSSLTLSAGTLALGSGLNHTVSTTVSVTGGTLDFGSSTLDVAVSSLDLSALAGTVPGTGSLKFSSGSAQAFIPPAVGLPNLNKTSAGTLTVGNAALTAQSLTLSGGTWNWGSTPRTHYLTSITGAGGNMDFAADTVEVSGDVSLGGLAGILSSSTGYLKFNNPGSQSFQPKAGATHPNLIKTGTGTVTMMTNNLICASLSISNGTFGFGPGPLTLTSNGLLYMTGGTLDVSTNTPTLVTGSWLDMTAGTLVATNGTLDANSSVIVRAGATFLCPASNPFTIRENLSVINGATFTTNSGTITMDAISGGQDVSSFYPLHNLVFNGTGGGWIPSMALNVNGTLTISAGTLNVSVVSGSVTAGNLTLGGGTFTATNGILDINGDFSMTGGTFDIPTSAANFKVAGSYIQSAGTMTSGVGAVRLDGTGTGKTVTATATLDLLEITGSGSWSLGSNLTVNSLSQSAGTFNLSSNNLSVNTGNSFSGGTFDFGSGSLHTMATTVNLNGLGTLVAGSGTLRFSGASAQTFTPKSAVAHPNITQYGAGGTTVLTNGFTTDVLTLNQGTFNLGSALSHTVNTVSDGGGGPYGSLDFGSSQLHVLGNIALGNLTSLIAGSGTLYFDGGSGSQFFTPKSGGASHPHIVHTTGTEIRLFTHPLTCLSFTMSNGSLDFNGQNLTTSGNLSITGGSPTMLTGLAGRTVTVGGTATFSGTTAANKLNLNPGTAWTLNATGAATATFATLNFGTATNPATCSNCTEGGNNSNWSFPVTWDGGGAGNNWTTADNWGSKTVPTSAQSVIFNGTSVKDVILNAAVTVFAVTMTGSYTGNLNFNGNTLTVQEGNADFRSGGTMTAAAGTLAFSGAAARLFYPFAGSGLPNLQHAGAGSLTVTGGNLNALNLTLSGAGAFNLGTGLTHNLAAISGSGWLTFGTSSVNATGDVNLSGMSVTASGANTLAFTGASAQNFTPNASVAGLNLTQNGAGGTLVSGYNFLTDNLTLTSGTFNLGSGRTHITTAITASGGNLHFGSSTLKVSAASVSLSGLGTLNAASGTLEFNGASAQTFVPKSGATHPTLRQNGAGGTTLLANVITYGLELNSGILNLGSGLWMVADGFSVGSGGLDFGSSTLRISAATVNLNSLSSLSAASGTLEFTGSSTQAFTPKTATTSPALLQTGSGITTLGGDVNAPGFSMISGEVDLVSYALSTSGNLSVTGGVLTATNGSLDVNGNLNASGGTLKFPSANPFTVAGNITITAGSSVIHNSGSLTLDGTSTGLTIDIGLSVNNLVVNGSGGEWTATGSAFTADGALSIVAGALKLGTALSHLAGSVTSSGGTLDFGSSTMRVNNGNANLSGLTTLVPDAGTLHFLHTGAQVLTPKNGATHPLILKSGAGDLAISAYDLITKGFNLSAGGLNLNGRNITVNNGGNFNLANGGPGTISNLSGATLTVAGNASFSGASGASRLNLNPGATWTVNVAGSLTANFVTLSYANAAGSQGQCSNCANGGSNTNWNFITVWDGGGADNFWATPDNWGSDAVPTAGEDVIFNGTNTKDVTLGAGATCKSLTFTSAYTGVLTVNAFWLTIATGNADMRGNQTMSSAGGSLRFTSATAQILYPKSGATHPGIIQAGAGGTTISGAAYTSGDDLQLSTGTLTFPGGMTHTVKGVSTSGGNLALGNSTLRITGAATSFSALSSSPTGAATVEFIGGSAQMFWPHASSSSLKIKQNGAGGTTVMSNGLEADSLLLASGPFLLGSVSNVKFNVVKATAGTLDFGSANLYVMGQECDLTGLTGITPGTGRLVFYGGSAQAFKPAAGILHPEVHQYGGGTTTIAANALNARFLYLNAGTFDLGSGFTHVLDSLQGYAASLPAGTLTFNNSTVQIKTGYCRFGALGVLNPGTGTIAFTAASGSQVFIPNSIHGQLTLPAITHSGAGTILLNDTLKAASFTQTAGAIDFSAGYGLSTVGDLSITNAGPSSVLNLGGRTLTVGGNATLTGTSGASKVGLNPGSGWTLAVTGVLNATYASLANNTATVSAGACSNCANGGSNSNWSFATVWDGGGADENWTTVANWGADALPTAAEDVTFNVTSVKNVVLDANANVKSITLATAYTGGFNFGSANLTVTGLADFRSGGSITPGTGTLTLAGTSAQAFHPLSSATFPDIVKNGAGTTTVTTNALTAGNISLAAGTFHLGTGFTHAVNAVSGSGSLHFGSSNLNASGNVNLGSATVTANSGNTLTFTGATGINYTPNASVTALNLAQNGAGGTTVITNAFTASGLTLVSGVFNLGTGFTHTISTLIDGFGGGGLHFGSSTLQIQATTINLSALGGLTAGSGTLKFTGASAQTFTPKASATYPGIVQYGAGGTTVATNNLTAGSLTLNQGFFRLGTGLNHSFTSVSDGGGGPYGSLDFGSSQLHATGDVQLGNLTALTAGTGSLHFDKASGSQIFVPKSGGAAHPAILHAGADSLKLYTHDLTCASFTQSAGTLDLNGRNLSTSGSGNFTVTNAGANAFGGLGGRTITVGGNASITGAASANRANLDPGSAWTFAVTGTLSATYASVANNTASPAAGACTHCANSGGNSNWTFVTGWDGGGADNNWTTAANWGSDAVPSVLDDVTFDATSAKSVVLDQDRSIRSLVMTSGYTGNFDFSSFRLTLTGATADFRTGGTLTAGTGTLDFGAAVAQTFYPKAGHVYPNLEVSGAGGAAVSGAGIDGAGNLVITSGSFALGTGFSHLVAGVSGSGALNFGTSELKAAGNVNLSGLTVTASGNRLTFANSGAQSFTPKAGLSTLTYRKNGAGTTTVLANNFTTDSLLLSAGTLDLGTGLSHSVITALNLTGGSLAFSSSTLKTQAATVDLRNLAAITPGTGSLQFERTSAQTFIPHASATLPQLAQYATGGTTTVTTNPIQSSAALTIFVGTFHLGAGLTHTVASMGGTGGSGTLDFGSSTLRIATGSAYLSQVAAVTPGTGALDFTAATGTQILSPLTGYPAPAVLHSGPGTLQAGGAVTCASFSQTAGGLDLNGYDFITTGNFTIANGTSASIAGLAGRTLTVGGDATLNGTSTATKIGLNPGSAWTLAATGSLIANLAALSNNTASVSAGTCGSCVNGGANSNWSFATVWDGGGADTKWTTAGNWSGDVVPSSSEDIVFNATSVKNALLDTTVTINALTFASGYTGAFDFGDKQLTLTTNADFRGGQTTASTAGSRLSFSISGSAQLYPKAGNTLPDVTLATAGTLSIGPAALTAGDLTITSGTVSLSTATHTIKSLGGTGTLAMGGGSLVILGDADLSSLAGLTTSGGAIQLATTGANTLTPKASLTHPAISKTGSGQITIASNGLATPSLTLAAGTLSLGTGLTHSVTTTLAVSGGSLAFGSSTLRTAAATLDMSALAGLTPGTGTLELNNASAQAFTPAAAAYPRILRTGTGATTVSGNHLTAASLQLDSGTLAMGTRTLTVNGLAQVNGATLDAAGGSLIVNGALDVQNGILECPATGLFQVTGALTYVGSTGWHHQNGTLTLAGAATGGNVSLAAPVYNLVVNGAGSTWTLASHLTVNSHLTLTAGTLDANANARDITVSGNTLLNGGSMVAAAGRIFLTGDYTQTSGSMSRPNASGVFSVAGHFAQSGGTMTLNGGKLTLAPSGLGQNLSAVANLGIVEINSIGGIGATGSLTAGSVTIAQGSLQLGTALSHAFSSLTATGGALNFGSSELHIATGNADFSGLATLTPNIGTLHLDAASGTQILSPKAGSALPPIVKTGSGTLRFAAAISAQGLTVSAGSIDFNGFDLTTSAPGHLAVSNGTSATFTGLAGRTLNIAGNAAFTGQAANHLNLNPASAWTLAVSGTLTGSYADVRYSTASAAAGTCSDCANQGSNANWAFTIAWDGGGADNNWTTAANWGSDAVPAATDYVTFNATSVKNAALDVDAAIGSIAFTAGYTGTFDFGIRALTVSGDADFRSGGAFANTSGKLVFAGAGAHTLIPKAGGTLPVIEQNGAGATTVSALAPLTAAGLVLANGEINLVSGTHSVGAVSAAAPTTGTLTFGSATLRAAGNVDLAAMTVSPGTGFLEFNGTSAQTFTPKAGAAAPGLKQSGTGGTTVLANGFRTPSLAMSAGSFNLGAGLSDTVNTTFSLTGGTLDFGSAYLFARAATIDFSGLGGINAGTGILEFNGVTAQTFTPKAGAVHPALKQFGTGGTTFAGVTTLTLAGNLGVATGTLTLNGTVIATGFGSFGGSLDFAAATLRVTGNADFSVLAGLTPGTGTLQMANTGTANLIPKAGVSLPNVVQFANGTTTVISNPMTLAGNLTVQAGTLSLGAGLVHQTQGLTVGGGALNFGSSTLGASGNINFATATGLAAGTGLLELNGGAAQTFTPKASLDFPVIRQNGAGGTTVTGDDLRAPLLQIVSGTFNLGTARSHSLGGLATTGGGLAFGSSQMRLTAGNADFSGLAVLTPGTGSTHFEAATGVQLLTSHGSIALAPVYHTAAGTLRLANNLAATGFNQTSGIVDLNGNNIAISGGGSFTVINGAPGTFTGLAGRTLTVAGNASLAGSSGSLLALDPGSAWTLAVTGSLAADFARLANCAASVSGGTATNSADLGGNSNWTFAVSWTGGGADNNWTTGANWGSGAAPGPTIAVVFDAGSVKNAVLDADATVKSIAMTTGYTGSFDFTTRTLGVLGNADFRSGGAIIPGTGSLAFAGTGAQSFFAKPAATFPHLQVTGSGAVTVQGSDMLAGNLTVTSGSFLLGSGAVRAVKGLSGSGTLDFGTANLTAAGNVDLSGLTVTAASANTLYFNGASAQTFRPKASVTGLSLGQTGAGGTTVINTGFTVPSLVLSAGTLNLGTGLTHTIATAINAPAGTLDFGSSTLNLAAAAVDLSGLTAVIPGAGTLAFTGATPQTFTPKAGAPFPALIQNGAGGTTVALNGVAATGLTVQAGAFNLGTGLTHSLATLATTGGGLEFGSSAVNLTGAGADFSGLATLTATAGKLVFNAATGNQTLTPKAGAIHPRIEHTGAGTLMFSAYDLICRSLLNQAGVLDFNGRNLTISAGGALDLFGVSGAMANLGGRTLTVDGNALLRGQPANRINLDPGAPWTLAVTGTLRAVHADLRNSLASVAAGIADSSVNLNGNANWTFIDTIKPANVTNFQARRVGGHAVELAWTPSASSDADSVMLRYRTDGAYPASRTDGILWRSVAKAAALDTAPGLADKALYRFAAFVKDSSGNYSPKAASDEDTAWLPDVTAPANVGGLTAVVLGPTSTALSWTVSPSADVDSVMVRYRTDGAYPTGNSDGALFKVFRTDRLSDTATGLTGNVLYHYAAFTRDSAGNWCPPAAGAQDTALYQAPILGTVTISDNLGRTKDADPALAFTHSGADSMRFALIADTAAAVWKPLRSLDSLALSVGADGKRVVAAQFKNIYGRRSAWHSDTTLLDRQAPVVTINVNADHSWRNWNDALSGKAFDSTAGTDSVFVIRKRLSDGSYFNGAGWSTVADTAKFRADSVFSVPMPNSAMATGQYDFTAIAKDKLGIVSVPLTKRVAYTENRAPETALSTIPDSALQNQTVAWTLELGDLDASDSVLSVSAILPAWLAMTEKADTAKGAYLARRSYAFTGKPGQSDLAAASTLTIQARDLGGKSFIYTKTLKLIDVNDPPVFAAGQDSLKAKEDSVSRFAPKYADLDPKDTHTLALLTGPAYATIEDTVIALRPGSRDVGPAMIRVTVGDGKLLDTLDLAVNVANVNDAPVAFPSAKWQSPAVWKEDVVDSFTVVVVDMDRQDPVTLATILPPFLTYKTGADSSGYNRYFRFAAAPAQKDTGGYSLKLRFQDATGAFSELSLSAKVAAVNDTPTAVIAGRRTQGGAARITLDVQDQDGNAAATRFHYRLVGAKGDTVRSGISAGGLLALHPLADGEYTLAIKAEDEGGLKQPAYTLSTLSISGATSLSLDSARWNMIAYPGRALPAGGLGVGAAISSWDESAGDGSPIGRYAAGKASDSLVRGKGYWVRTANRIALSAPLSELLERPFALKLARGKQGWNQIGNPYPYSVDLSASGLVYWEWDAERRDLVNAKGILKPWGAYWVQVAKDTLLTIKDEPWFAPEGAQGPLAKSGADLPGFRHARDWTLQLALAAGPYRDASNYLGVRNAAGTFGGATAQPGEAGRVSDAPKFGDYVALRFEKPGTAGDQTDSLTHGYSADFRAQLAPDEEWWDFSIENSGTGLELSQLSIPGLENLAAQGLFAFLVDRGEATALSAENPVTLAMGGEAAHYSLVITPHADFAARLQGNFSISQNFPNPVRGYTTFRFALPQTWDKAGKRVAKDYRLRLNVYDYSGRLAAQVADGAFKPGSHSLVWKPQAKNGGNLAKGAYVYRLETQGFTKSLKLLVK